MDKKLELELVKKYPNLYKNYGGDTQKTCMAWGMTCGDGWYKIIDELSEKLEKLDIVAAQVKEKFGTLSFYIEAANEDVFKEAYKHIGEAENKSALICETCGEVGKRRGDGWVRTLCDKCETEKNKE